MKYHYLSFFFIVSALFMGAPSNAMVNSKQNAISTTIPSKIYGNNTYPIPYRNTLPLNAPIARYPGFKPESEILKKGTIRREGAMPLPCDIQCDRDVALTLRDGTKIYTDVFRPADNKKHPAIVAWSPYGKEIGGQWLDDIPNRSNIPLHSTSELQKFEGPDPAFWVSHGYIVLNPDPRGVGMSEGNITYWGRQLAEDGYDFIEWAAQQPWCSGKIGMAGNSFLTVSQWFIAAAQPPHLAAIAPWEGFVDHFHEAGNRGGIPAPQFPEMIIQSFAGNGMVEDQPKMIVTHQLMDDYWKDKQAQLKRITVPAYVVASYTNPIHTHGSFEGFRDISSQDKWLRVHDTHEWQDFYSHSDDLLKFFDHYLKGEDNGWLKTPRVRLSVLDPGGTNIINRPEHEWPLARTHYERLYLSSKAKLTQKNQTKEAELSYPVDKQGLAQFTYTFDKTTELTGYMKLRLWVEAQGSDDMELTVSVMKIDSKGKPYMIRMGEGMIVPLAASGLLRVSQRELDPARSSEAEPYLLNKQEQLLHPGEIVPVDIGIWPMGMIYHKGETLQLTVSAYHPFPDNLYVGFGAAKIEIPASGMTYSPGSHPDMKVLGGTPDMSPAYVKEQQVLAPASRNNGTHILHLGGKYQSYLLIPDVTGSI